jgi:ribosome biogenesis GTPase
MNARLDELGWGPFFETAVAASATEGVVPARVIIQQKTNYVVAGEGGEFRATITGKLRFVSQKNSEFPVVGDWVLFRPAPGERTGTIAAILPRRTAFSRRAAGREDVEQVAAANIDVVFLVTGLDENYNLRRIERYLVLATQGGARPVIVLNKADLCPSLNEVLAEVHAVAGGAPICVTNARAKEGVDPLLAHILPGSTAAFLGSSGVGKSTIINRLLGREKFKTAEVRDSDGRGRHTTSHRELVILPSGGILIDTPGMRELQLWESVESVDEVFDDIDALALGCRFRDCRHEAEPGCAVRKAAEEGGLSEERFKSYRRLQKEAAFQARRTDRRAQAEEKARVKKLMREFYRRPKKGR